MLRGWLGLGHWAKSHVWIAEDALEGTAPSVLGERVYWEATAARPGTGRHLSRTPPLRRFPPVLISKRLLTALRSLRTPRTHLELALQRRREEGPRRSWLKLEHLPKIVSGQQKARWRATPRRRCTGQMAARLWATRRRCLEKPPAPAPTAAHPGTGRRLPRTPPLRRCPPVLLRKRILTTALTLRRKRRWPGRVGWR